MSYHDFNQLTMGKKIVTSEVKYLRRYRRYQPCIDLVIESIVRIPVIGIDLNLTLFAWKWILIGRSSRAAVSQ